MTRRDLKRGTLVVFLMVLGILIIVSHQNTSAATAPQQSAQQTPAQTDEKPVEQTHKNIQVLKGLPDSQLIPMMQLFDASLGVRCDACHVRTPDNKWEFDKDDKKMKQTARKMIQMTMDLNKANFEGRPEVSCFTCHHGGEHPVTVPPLPQPAEAHAEAAKPSEQWPTPPQILDKYLQAVGGKDAIAKIKSRSIKGSLVTADGTSLPFEIAYQSPDKIRAAVSTKQGDVIQVLDGNAGWVKNERENRPLNPIEILRIKSLAQSLEPLVVASPPPRMVFAGKEKLGDHDVYRIGMATPDRRRVRLYFDVQSGLLLRKVILRDTPVGQDPEQTDYDDYRDVDGVKVPFSIRISYTSNNISGTRKITEIKTNAPIDAAKFAAPK